MENINRDDFDLSYRISIDITTIQKCIDDLNNFNMGSREEYYSKCVLQRFDKCNENYVKEFDNTLNKIYNELYEDDNFDYQRFQKLLKTSTKLTSQVYDNYINLLYSLT